MSFAEDILGAPQKALDSLGGVWSDALGGSAGRNAARGAADAKEDWQRGQDAAELAAEGAERARLEEANQDLLDAHNRALSEAERAAKEQAAKDKARKQNNGGGAKRRPDSIRKGPSSPDNGGDDTGGDRPSRSASPSWWKGAFATALAVAAGVVTYRWTR